MTIELALAIITAIGLLWGVLQVVIAWRLDRQTRKLEHQVQRLNVAMDQSIQRLHRAREALIQRHKAHVYLLEYVEAKALTDEPYFAKRAELSAAAAELRGLAIAINDSPLLSLINDGPNHENSDDMFLKVGSFQNWSQQVHTRISELLEAATKEVNAQ